MRLERKIQTTKWATQVGSTLLGMCIIDTSIVDIAATGTSELQPEFYTLLAEQLIDKTDDESFLGLRQWVPAVATSPDVVHARIGAGLAGVQAHLTPTIRRRKLKYGTIANH